MSRVGILGLVVGTAAGFACSGDDSCEFETTELALDEESPFGYSADEVLDTVEGTYTATLQWGIVSPSLDHNIEEAETELTLEVRYDGAPIQFLEGTPCNRSSMETNVTLILRTADGMLDEQIPARFVKRSVPALFSPPVDGGSISVSGEGDPGFEGFLELGSSPEAKIRSWRIQNNVRDGVIQGYVEIDYEERGVRSYDVQVAAWPAEE